MFCIINIDQINERKLLYNSGDDIGGFVSPIKRQMDTKKQKNTRFTLFGIYVRPDGIYIAHINLKCLEGENWCFSVIQQIYGNKSEKKKKTKKINQ